MKKLFIIVILMVTIPVVMFATSYQSLYTLDVPYKYQSLYVTGNFTPLPPSTKSNEILNITIDTSPTVTFAANASVNGDYTFVDNAENSYLRLSSSGSYVEFGSTGFKVNAAVNGNYKNYAFTIASIPAYYQVVGNGNIFFNLPFSGGTSSFSINLNPTVGVGIGKIHNIQTIKSIVNTMEYFNITPTQEMVEEIAKIEYAKSERLNSYSNNDALLWTSYQRELAAAYGIDEKIVELIYRNVSQVHSFETLRWANLNYGWEAFARIIPAFEFITATTNSFTLSLGFALGGQWATLLADESIYIRLYADLIPTIETNLTPLFSFLANASVDARYFFSDPRMWVDSSLTLGLNTRVPTKFDLDIDAIFNYLIAPNFSAYGGLRMLNTFDTMSIVVGGELRLF